MLVRAIAMPEGDAEAAWHEWRASIDVTRIDSAELQMLPVLGKRLARWLEGDPAAGRFRGIVRRAWTESQLRLSAFRSLAMLLERSGCGPVMAGGSVAVALLNRLPDSVRPVSDIRMVVRREHLERTVQVLRQEGWRLSGKLPAAEGLDWTSGIHLYGQGMSLIVQWRVLAVPLAKAAAVEQEFFQHRRRMRRGDFSVWTPSPEQALLMALRGRQDFDRDPIPWQVDAALLPIDGIAWRRWTALAERFAPEAFERLEEIRGLGVAAPKIRRKPAGPPSQARMLYGKWRSRLGRLVRGARRRLRSRR